MDSEPTLTENDLLKSLLGKQIVAVKRQLFMPDIEYGLSKEAADGPIEFTLEDDEKVYFEALTTPMTVEIREGAMRKLGESYQPYDCSGSAFWKTRKNSPIRSIQILREFYTASSFFEPAVKFILANGAFFHIEYVGNTENKFDAICLAEQPESSNYELVYLK